METEAKNSSTRCINQPKTSRTNIYICLAVRVPPLVLAYKGRSLLPFVTFEGCKILPPYEQISVVF